MKVVRPLDAIVLLSGSGTTFQNLLDQARAGICAIRMRGVISSRPDAFGIQRARTANIPARVVNRKDYTDSRSFSEEVVDLINAIKPELVVMAGWMSLLELPPYLVGRTINIHPALLPKFGGKGMYGLHVHEAVVKAKAKESGCTVHWVTNEYDAGPVILQKTVPVMPDDTPSTLQNRVQLVEREAYPEAINMIAEGAVWYENGRTVFASKR